MRSSMSRAIRDCLCGLPQAVPADGRQARNQAPRPTGHVAHKTESVGERPSGDTTGTCLLERRTDVERDESLIRIEWSTRLVLGMEHPAAAIDPSSPHATSVMS